MTHRRGRRLVLTGFLAVATTLPGAARAQDSDDPAQEAAAEPIRLELIDQELGFEQDQPIRLTYRVTGDLEAATIVLPEPERPRRGDQAGDPPNDDPAGSEVAEEEQPADPPPLALQITNYQSIDVDRLDGVVGSDVDRLAFGFASDGVELDDARDLVVIQDDGSGIMELEIPTDSGISDADHLRFDDAGLYALRVELVRGEFPFTEVLATAGTAVQRLDATSGSTPLHLALMGAVAEPPIDADEATLQDSAAEVLTMTGVASTVGSPATWSFPPRVVDALADDVRAPDLATDLAGDELASRPAVPLDVSAAAGVDRVTSFTRQLRVGEEILTDAVPTAPTRRDVWISEEPLSTGAAEALRDLGTRYVAMTAELYTSTVGEVPPTTDEFIEIELPRDGRLPLLVLDPFGLRLVETVTPSLSPTEYAVRNAAELLLESVLVDDPGGRSRILSGAGFGPLDGQLVADLERIAATTPDLRFSIGSALTGLTRVATDGDGIVSIELPDTVGADLTARVQVLNDASAELLDAVAMLPGDDPRPTAWRDRIETLLSTGYSDEEVLRSVAALLEEAEEITDAVVAPEPFTFTLTGKTGEIEILVGNVSDDVLTVVVDLSSSKLLFPDGATTVELQPNEETKVVVPVEARANGTSSVTVAVRSPSGTDLVEPVKLTSRVTTFTGLGQVLTGGLVLVLLTWWFTHWRARRRAELAAGADRHPAGTGPVATG